MRNTFSTFDRECLDLAIKTAKKSYLLGNYPVGAVLSVDGKKLGSVGNEINKSKSFIKHAEISLIIAFAPQLYQAFKIGKQAVLYSTLEPCIQCLGASVTNRISKIVYIQEDPNGGACDIKHDSIGLQYKDTWPETIHAPVSNEPLLMMAKFFKEEIKRGNIEWPAKMLKLYEKELQLRTNETLQI